MDKLDFVTWLRGWVELNDGAMPTERQWEIIKDHLNLGFAKVTPDRTPPKPDDQLQFVKPSNLSDILKRGVHDHIELYPQPPAYINPYWLDTSLPSRNSIMC